MNRLYFLLLLILLFSVSCNRKYGGPEEKLPDKFLVVLGIMQDAGYPQAGCQRDCCNAYWEAREPKELVTSLALVDRKAGQYWLIEATPDIIEQLHSIQSYILSAPDYSPDGIFITHAHTGHYTGLMQLGREAMGAKDIPVWVMPRMDSFLRHNGPWSQLVNLKNIQLNRLNKDSTVQLGSSFNITPLTVPHRDEYSETVGFMIETSKKKVLFIPDIDKWEKWNKDIRRYVLQADTALIDGTFYQNGELPGRDMSEVPHPFVEETMQLFSGMERKDKARLVFIHFNHTNPLLKLRSPEKQKVKEAGFGVAKEGMIIEL